MMQISWKKHLAALLLVSLPLVVSGCGGGGGGAGVDDGAGTAVISGVATKGPIKKATVEVYLLLPTGARGALIGSTTSADDGSYAISVPQAQAGVPLLITVTGNALASYASESKSGEVAFGAAESFNAAVFGAAPGEKITVSPLTEAAFQKLPQILAAKPDPDSSEKLAASIVAANARIGAIFNIQNILAPPAGDTSYQAALYIIDQMVEDSKSGGAISDTSGVMNLLNLAVADTGAPAYQSFVQVLTAATEKARTANPTLATVIDALLAKVASPPAEPDLGDLSAPTAPSGLAASTSAITATTSSVSLSWSPSTDNREVAGYEVFRDGTLIGTVTTTAYTDPSVVPNVTYLYTVRAFDAAGNRSAASSALSVTPNKAILEVTVSGQVK